MSGDETDTPTGVYPKAVRHIEIPWISPHISQLFEAVDSYKSSLRVEHVLTCRKRPTLSSLRATLEEHSSQGNPSPSMKLV